MRINAAKSITGLMILLLGGCGGAGTTDANDLGTLSFLETSIPLGLKASVQLTVFAHDKAGGRIADVNGLAWSSSDPAIASVDANGVVTGHVLGPVVITVRKNAVSGSTTVTVTPASIQIMNVPDSISIGQSLQLSAIARDAFGGEISAGPVSWSVNVPTSASVSPNGLLTGLAPGMFDVSATASGRTDRATTGVPSTYDGGWLGYAANNPVNVVLIVVRLGTVTSVSLTAPLPMCTTVNFSAPTNGILTGATFTVTVGSALLSGTFASPTTLAGSYGQIFIPAPKCDDGHMLSAFPHLGPATFVATKSN